MVVQLGLLIYRLASGQCLLHGMYSIKQVLAALEHGMLRPSLDGVLNMQSPLAPEGHNTQGKQRVSASKRLQQSGARQCGSVRLPRRRHKSVTMVRSCSEERDVSKSLGIPNELTGRLISHCSKLCLQVMIEHCLCQASLDMGHDWALYEVQRSLSLCCSATQWSPALLPYSVTCTTLHLPRKWQLWATAVPTLQLGSLDLLSGHVNEKRLTMLPETMPHLRYKHRHIESEERATAMSVAEDACQLWVGVEKGNSGAVYVFEVPSLELLDSTDLEDQDTAVLSVFAMPPPDQTRQKQLVLVGLACGELLVFIASLHDSSEEVYPTRQCVCRVKSGIYQPCMAMAHSGGTVFCSIGNHLAVLEPNDYLKSDSFQARYPNAANSVDASKVVSLAQLITGERGSCVERRYHRLAIMQLATCPLGVWLVQRHSFMLFLLDAQLQHCKAVVDCRYEVNQNTLRMCGSVRMSLFSNRSAAQRKVCLHLTVSAAGTGEVVIVCMNQVYFTGVFYQVSLIWLKVWWERTDSSTPWLSRNFFEPPAVQV